MTPATLNRIKEKTTQQIDDGGYLISQKGDGFDAILTATHPSKPTYQSAIYSNLASQADGRKWEPFNVASHSKQN